MAKGRKKGSTDRFSRVRRNVDQIILDDFYDMVGKAAQELTFEIQSAYEKSVDEFYGAYTPILYKRTENTYRASDHFNQSWVSRESQRISGGYIAGISVSADFIMENGGEEYVGGLMSIYDEESDPMRFVFTRSFERGIHGFNRNDVNTVNGKRDKGNEWHPKRVPKNSTPIQKIMNAYFKELTKRKHINDLIFAN